MLPAAFPPMSESHKAVFLSYASQDAEAVRHVAEALRAAGIEVWFDQSELRGGDAWDRHIRKQIHDCRLFIAVISAHTDARSEGYFRREWRLAVDRTQDMADDEPFLLPVVIDNTHDATARVPDKFREVQWARLPGGETSPAFVERVVGLLADHPHAPAVSAVPAAATHEAAAPPNPAAASSVATRRAAAFRGWPLVVASLVVVAILASYAIDRLWLSRRAGGGQISPATAVSRSTGENAIPEKSIAVLPFADMSEKKDQEYFSDGLAEELLDLLAQVPNLRVPARTSSFYFKGKQATIAEIAKALGVAHVLEGSVRKAGDTIRVTVQLIRADSGYHLWSKTYDRDMKDIFAVQDEIAAATVKALSASLLGGAMPQAVKASSTDAYAVFLQGRALMQNGTSRADRDRAIADLEQATRLDPGFAAAWAELSRAQLSLFFDYRVGSPQQVRKTVLDSAERAIALDAASAEAYLMKGRVLMTIDRDWVGAEQAVQKALELDGTNPDILRNAAYHSESLGRYEEAVQRNKAATEADPLSFYNHMKLGFALYLAGKPEQAEAEYRTAIGLQPHSDELYSDLALALLAQGKREAALAEAEKESDPAGRALTLPLVLAALGRTAEADRARAEAEAKFGAFFPNSIGCIYAAQGNLTGAFEWWDRALRERDPDLPSSIKFAPLITGVPSLATDPRYKALLRKLNLPA
jgi:TolB-like protein/Flp pilus assembly protein TadD